MYNMAVARSCLGELLMDGRKINNAKGGLLFDDSQDDLGHVVFFFGTTCTYSTFVGSLSSHGARDHHLVQGGSNECP